MKQKQVKIIGLSINETFGGLKATQLEFDKKNRLTVFKGEVGSGKTTLNRAMRLTTQGSSTLEDKSLYGNVDITTQLKDGDTEIFVGCKTGKENALDYYLYTVIDGKKVNKVVIDGEQLTPAGYLKSLQTALTWRMDELTSENATTQRNILLELYSTELEEQGVIFDKKNPNYIGGIIHKIEEAKNRRSLMDMKRKEVGGIADDLLKKGINFDDRRTLKDESKIKKEITGIESKISLAETNAEQVKKSRLNELKANGQELATNLRIENDKLKAHNDELDSRHISLDKIRKVCAEELKLNMNVTKLVVETVKNNLSVLDDRKELLEFSEKGSCLTKAKKYNGSKELKKLLKEYSKTIKAYIKENNSEEEVDTTELEKELAAKKEKLEKLLQFNKETAAINSFHDWRESDQDVRDLKKDYYFKLTKINTGVKGLHICPETEIEDGEIVAKNDNIYLMYNGQYDTKYFNNEDQELRKLSSYSGTQKPLICLLIQNYLLSKKNKSLPYLWIDNIPIDNKTKELLNKMAKELDLWLFVNWTGDFDTSTLKDGEVLIQGGKILFRD
jgi:hypothetical protein